MALIYLIYISWPRSKPPEVKEEDKVAHKSSIGGEGGRGGRGGARGRRGGCRWA